MTIPYFLLWVLYLLITVNKRSEYFHAKRRGHKCIGSKDTSMLIYGSERTYYFDPNQEPEREYVTWKEYWNDKGYLLKTKNNGI